MRKKSQKFFLGLISMILVVSMVAGCSGKSTSTPDNSEKPNGNKQEENASEEKVDVISVWTNNAARKDADFEMVEEFNNTIGKEKGIKIDYKVYGGDYGNTIRLAMAAGEAPHLFKLPGNVSEMVAAAKVKHILPISDLPGGEEWLKKYDGMLDPVANMYDGKVYSVPHSTSAIAVAYNKELLAKNGFNEPPKTWSELREMAKVVTENGNGKEFGFIDGLKSGSIANWNGLYHYVASVGHTGWDHKKGEYAYKDFAPFFDMLAKMRFEDKSWFPGAEGLDNDATNANWIYFIYCLSHYVCTKMVLV